LGFQIFLQPSALKSYVSLALVRPLI